MWILTLLSMLSLFNPMILAEESAEGEGDGLPRLEDLVEKVEISSADHRGMIWVSVRGDGHSLPYILETRASCKKKIALPFKLPAVESVSFCEFERKTLKISRDLKTATLTVFDVDAETMNLPLEKRDLSGKITCLKKSRQLVVDLTSLCPRHK